MRLTSRLFVARASIVGLAICGAGTFLPAEAQTVRHEDATPDNPLLGDWHTPFGVPPFSEIEDADYLPAFRATIVEHDAEIAAIMDNPDAPSFANTIEALERSGQELSRVSRVFFAVNAAHSNDVIRDVARTVAPELSAHRDDITLNRDLYARVKAVYDSREQLDLDPDKLRLL